MLIDKNDFDFFFHPQPQFSHEASERFLGAPKHSPPAIAPCRESLSFSFLSDIMKTLISQVTNAKVGVIQSMVGADLDHARQEIERTMAQAGIMFSFRRSFASNETFCRQHSHRAGGNPFVFSKSLAIIVKIPPKVAAFFTGNP